MRSIVAQHARLWPDGDVYVGCSGNLTIERTLAPSERFRLHSNDVNAYSCALGWYYSGQPVPFAVAEESADQLGWLHLDGYLDDGAGTIATLMLGTRFLEFVGKTGTYHQRMVAAYREQFPRMHAETVAKIESSTLNLASFTAGDVLDWLRNDVPADAPFLSFPPFDSGGYEAMFSGITDHFTWPEPAYDEFADDAREQMISLVTDRPHWILGLLDEAPELEDYRVGYVQTGPRARPFWVYAKPGVTRWVGPKQKTEHVFMPRLGEHDELGEDLTLHPITAGQFNTLRSAYLNNKIAPGAPLFSCAVSSGGRIIGAFGYLPPKYGLDAYLMSDFGVAPTRYKRLSKLVVMAAISSEAQQLVQRTLSKRVTNWSTTAFSHNPTSAKYGRGVPGVTLQSRKPCDDGEHEYMLNYGGPLGQWTLPEALAQWRGKHNQEVPA